MESTREGDMELDSKRFIKPFKLFVTNRPRTPATDSNSEVRICLLSEETDASRLIKDVALR
jgi:hypothetical protein